MGNDHERSGNLSEAIRWYERARGLSPRDPGVYFELASVFEKNGSRRAAIENYERFLHLAADVGVEFRSEVMRRIARLREVEH